MQHARWPGVQNEVQVPSCPPTEVSHLAVVVGLSTYDPKDF